MTRAPTAEMRPPMKARDLSSFCCDWRKQLAAPFSRGAFTYASNGQIALRIARDDDAPENPEAPAVEKIMANHDFDALPFAPPPPITLPPRTFTNCEECEGSGTQHECPDCTCKCDECEGKGVEDDDNKRSIGIDGRVVSVALLRRLLALPGFELGPVPGHGSPWPFRFSGGVGVFVCRYKPAKNHTEIERELLKS